MKNRTIFKASQNEIEELSHRESIIKHTFVDFTDIQNKEEFIEKLYRLYQEVFSGGNYESFKYQYFCRPKPDAVFVHIMKNQQDEWIGYSLVKRFMVNYPEHVSGNANTFAIFRALSLILPAYRGHHYKDLNLPLIAMEMEIDRFHKLNPQINIAIFALLFRPESLILLSKRQPLLSFPSPFKETPMAVKDFMIYLRNLHGYTPDERSPYAVKSAVTSILSGQKRKEFMKSDSPYVKYFRDITGLKDGIILMGLTFRFIVPHNPFFSEPTKTYTYLDPNL
jgi:hypothetical protein